MVKGLDVFRDYFKKYKDNYVIIGGTACDIIIDAAGLTPRATRDIDIILVVEALSAEFVTRFWEFVKAGKYERVEQHNDERKYYRFLNPADERFPYQVEFFSRTPDILNSKDDAPFTPIPVEEDISSLSAILMNEDYYTFTLQHSTKEGELNRADTEALICLKAKAHLDLKERKEKGEKVDNKHIKKHKADVFRLANLLVNDVVFELPESIKKDMQQFMDSVKGELPDKALFKEMGLGNVDVPGLYSQLHKSFKLDS